MATIQGKAMWAHVYKPDNYDAYSINLVVGKAEAEVLENQGLTVNETDEGFVVKFKRNFVNKSGKPNQPPTIVDAQKKTITDAIGNGSIVNVQYRPYEWSFKNKKGVSADLVAVQVIDLVAYGEDSIEFEEAEGFVAEDIPDIEFDNSDPFEDVS